MKVKVSVLLPVFNAESTLPECLDSLLAQDFNDFEIVAVDDGSTDGSSDILFDYGKKDPRIRIITVEHAGIVAGLQTAFANADADYLARMDADDICTPDRLRRQVEFLDANKNVAVVGSLVGPIPGESLAGGYETYLRWINSLVDPEEIADNIYVESPLPHPSVVFHRSPYLAVGGYQDHRWPEDYDLWLRMHQSGYRFAKVPEVLVYWRDYPERTSRNRKRYDREAFFEAKAYYLALGPLKDVEEVVIIGAGRVTRNRVAYLEEYGIKVAAFIDVDKNKIGQFIKDTPVIPPSGLSAFPEHIILSYVSNWGARDEIRTMLTEMGKIEGKDFFLCA